MKIQTGLIAFFFMILVVINLLLKNEKVFIGSAVIVCIFVFFLFFQSVKKIKK